MGKVTFFGDSKKTLEKLGAIIPDDATIDDLLAALSVTADIEIGIIVTESADPIAEIVCERPEGMPCEPVEYIGEPEPCQKRKRTTRSRK